MTPNETHVDKEGYFVKSSSAGVAALCTAATDIPVGCIVEGEATTGLSSIAVCDAGEIVRVKVHSSTGTIIAGTYLTVTSTGTVIADAGSGNRVRVARALESGAANELIEAVLIYPLAIAA